MKENVSEILWKEVFNMKSYAVTTELKSSELKVLRKKLGLTQAEFARLANVSTKTIERWETSDKPITGPVVTLAGILKLRFS